MKKSELEAINKFVILTANNEQNPFKYPNTKAYSMPMSHGDYTLEYEGKVYLDKIIVERKGNISELYEATGKGRDRWERELENLSKVDVAMVLCEFSYMDIKTHRYGKLEPQCIYGSICKWHTVYGVPFIFCENRRNARAYLYKTFFEYVKYKILGLKQ